MFFIIITFIVYISCRMIIYGDIQGDFEMLAGVRGMSRPDLSPLQDIRGEKYARLLMEMRARKTQ
jgi:hypothetical protein